MQVSISPNDSGAPNFTRGSREYTIDKASFFNGRPHEACIRVYKGRQVRITPIGMKPGESYKFGLEYGRDCNKILFDLVKKKCKSCQGSCGCDQSGADDLILDCTVKYVKLGGVDSCGQDCDWGDYYLIPCGDTITDSKIKVKEYSC